MITTIEIKNFRSILSQQIQLEPITVVIGANGSGKSNLVKALEFIGDIPRHGIDIATSRQGGAESIIPKVKTRADLFKTNTELNYRVRLLPPEPAGVGEIEMKSIPHFEVCHQLALHFYNKRPIKIESESLTFFQVLYISELLKTEKGLPKIAVDHVAHPSKNSQFEIRKKRGSVPSFHCKPSVTEETAKKYLEWLGLPSFDKKISTKEELQGVLNKLWEHRQRRPRKLNKERGVSSKYSFLDPGIRTILDFSPEFNYFNAMQSSIRRFDLLLHELRQEQQVGEAKELAASGNNMPSVLRSTSSTSSDDSWQRLVATFETIAPHISSMRSSVLRSGKEFVEFVETQGGRNIESWESSDGSLRALAILLAVETTVKGSTVIIEEPEQNLHPWAIRCLIDHIRQVVEERHIQVIITTHSEQVLSRVKSEEVRVATRSVDKGTEFNTLKDILPDSNIEMGEVGRLWVKGLLGGVPTEQ